MSKWMDVSKQGWNWQCQMPACMFAIFHNIQEMKGTNSRVDVSCKASKDKKSVFQICPILDDI